MKFTIMMFMFMKMYELGPSLKQSMFREGQDTDHGSIVSPSIDWSQCTSCPCFGSLLFLMLIIQEMYIMSLLWLLVVPHADNIDIVQINTRRESSPIFRPPIRTMAKQTSGGDLFYLRLGGRILLAKLSEQ